MKLAKVNTRGYCNRFQDFSEEIANIKLEGVPYNKCQNLTSQMQFTFLVR